MRHIQKKLNILFICSRNKKRSLTAETIFREHNEHRVRSAGTEDVARVRVSDKLVQWADIIFVMEKRHRQRLDEKFDSMSNKQVVVMDIPDDYEYMDVELIQMLKDIVAHYI